MTTQSRRCMFRLASQGMHELLSVVKHPDSYGPVAVGSMHLTMLPNGMYELTTRTDDCDCDECEASINHKGE